MPAAEVSHVRTPTPRTGLADDLRRWVAAGLLSEQQSAAILAHERRATTSAPLVVGEATGATRRRRVPVVAEALGYLGGVLAITGLVLLVAQYWPDAPTGARLALSGAGAFAFFAAGCLVREHADPALGRLRGFLWLASTAASALFVGVLTVDGLGLHGSATVVLTCGAAVSLQSGLLWQRRERPLQQVALLGGLVATSGALVAELASPGPVGLTVWIVGALFVLAGLRRRRPLPLLTEVTGALTVIVGTQITATGWAAFGLTFTVATAFGLLALAAVPGLAAARADQLIAAISGGVVLLVFVAPTLAYFSHDAAFATGVATWVIGGALILVGARRRLRLPVAAELLGAAAMLGGAALTVLQWPGLAPIFGIVTAIGLLALSTVPGQVLMSVFGALGLLVNVPWAISWFFPGEGRAPLLILVSGALILAVAVLLTRMGGRFRQELRAPPRG